MTKEELLTKAHYIQYPLNGKLYLDYSDEGFNSHVDKLPITDMTYKGWEMNENHFTTEYHRKFSLPLLDKVLNFGYNPRHFRIRKRTVDGFDISMPIPRKRHRFEVYGYTRDEYAMNMSYDDLLTNSTRRFDLTDYHRLYRYAHECSRIVNQGMNNGRLLFISGDSQMIPDVPVLACYYKEVWYFDNRFDRKLHDEWKDVDFDDVLIELNGNYLWFYTDVNLR